MASSVRKIKELIRWCLISRGGDDAGNFPVQQIEYLDKPADTAIHFPYGMHANVPKGTLALLWVLLGNSESRVAQPSSPLERIKVAVGEVVYFHPLTGAKIHFKADGGIEIDSKANLNVTVTGNVNIIATGDVNITATGNVILDAASIEAAAGATSGLMNEAALAVYNGHGHSGVDTPPTEQMVVGTDTTTKLKGS